MKTGIKVADAMSVAPVAIAPTKTVFECSKIMVKRRVGSVLVTSEEKLEGILTEKDLVEFLAKGLDPKKTKVKEIMTRKVLTIGPEEDIYDALHRMKKDKVRRLPVVSKKKLIGMLTQNDILKLQPALFDILVARGRAPLKPKKEKYIEGQCEICENFAQLHEVDDQFICAECKEEVINKIEEEEQ